MSNGALLPFRLIYNVKALKMQIAIKAAISRTITENRKSYLTKQARKISVFYKQCLEF